MTQPQRHGHRLQRDPGEGGPKRLVLPRPDRDPLGLGRVLVEVTEKGRPALAVEPPIHETQRIEIAEDALHPLHRPGSAVTT